MSGVSILNYFQITAPHPGLFSINQLDLAPTPIAVQNLDPGSLVYNKEFGAALLGCRQAFRTARQDNPVGPAVFHAVAL